MNAVEFVKKFGIITFKLSTSFVNTRKYLVVYDGEIDFTDEIQPFHGKCVFERTEVKRLVESWELVERLGGLESSLKERDFRRKQNILQGYDQELSEAIADVESVGGGV